VHLAYIWIVCHLSAKNYQNWWKFDAVLRKTNLLSFFWDTVYVVFFSSFLDFSQITRLCRQTRDRLLFATLFFDCR